MVGLWKWNDKLIVKEIIYQKGMTNKEIALKIKRDCQKGGVIVGDSAEPKSLDELMNYGLNIYPAKKGKDSILHSIQLIQQFEILVTDDSINLIKELRGYVWSQDKNGHQENRPSQYCQDHLIDAMRYISQRTLDNFTVDYTIY
jgi:phage terminase large subunit